MDERICRRHVLSAAAIALAGCSSQSESGTGDTTETTTDGLGTDDKPTTAEEDSPEVNVDAWLSTPETPGTLRYEIAVEAEETVDAVTLATPATDLRHTEFGDGPASVSGTIEADPGVLNEVSVTVETSSGTATESVGGQYARKYAVVSDTTVDVGGVYIPFMGTGKWSNCTVGTPTVGEYSLEGRDFDAENRAAVSRHLDQHQGFGVGPVMFNFGENFVDRGRFRNLRESPLSDEVELECFYVLSQALRRNRSVEGDLTFVREEMFPLDNYATLDGRPLVQVWGGYQARWMLEDAPLVPDRSVPEHVDWLREQLTPEDGPQPFIVTTSGDYGRWERQEPAEPDETTRSYMHAFDGYTTWFPHLRSGEQTEWETALEETEAEFDGLRTVAEEQSQAVIPTVYPGFDDRGNACWGEERYLPRSVERFEELFALADEYRTHDRVNVATWNDWNEGTMIEPGAHDEQAFGTSYLDVIREYATDGSENRF